MGGVIGAGLFYGSGQALHLLILGPLVAIAISPLTDISVWAGGGWLLVLAAWWVLYARRHNLDHHVAQS